MFTAFVLTFCVSAASAAALLARGHFARKARRARRQCRALPANPAPAYADGHSPLHEDLRALTRELQAHAGHLAATERAWKQVRAARSEQERDARLAEFDKALKAAPFVACRGDIDFQLRGARMELAARQQGVNLDKASPQQLQEMFSGVSDYELACCVSARRADSAVMEDVAGLCVARNRAQLLRAQLTAAANA
ncbi:hypothetical protein [Ramlibacter alkalitolerans]|uniref:Lysozyme inhibitor LprI N-terminal domain-containing protein n=1 Tax=Ramlibacter alkalitolerans TaxID=2039631 RepID=A0ABS1JU72_9BURK|nr:hypothetical protein [Ramlibacter alkalitolerans]MBL0427849.1 hypothetical protein [Ramlibacter alkalitolerans]